ncbi:sensor histidine kinase [Balneatrix alpica]|uniref:histidine kinase n=1 Tax=Balneatrix alpica TaxID=75684 RepID=A0ABV5ZE79_9GAMM|nr:ATP-binding protein [Balneatrix alpica]
MSDPKDLLSAAFAEFNALAAQLSERYHLLEQEVHDLRAQLAQRDQAQRQEEEARQAITDQLDVLLELLPIAMVLIDNRGQIRRANPAALALLGEPLLNCAWVEVISRSFAPQEDDGHEISLRNGRRVSVMTNSLPGQAGQIVLLHDLTETRALQARLSQHERLTAMGRMVAALAHQVRTPLAAALLYASHLQTEELSEPQRLNFAGKLRERLVNIEQQIRDMLIFARGEAQLTEVMTVSELLLRLESALDVPLASFDADCDWQDESAGARIQLNSEVLLGALLNLVNNGLQAAGEGCALCIRALRQGEEVVIQVEDNGPGIASEHLPRVLEPFYTTKPQGTGLGLAVVQAVAKAHGGRFELSSAPGCTCASMILPLLKGSADES